MTAIFHRATGTANPGRRRKLLAIDEKRGYYSFVASECSIDATDGVVFESFAIFRDPYVSLRVQCGSKSGAKGKATIRALAEAIQNLHPTMDDLDAVLGMVCRRGDIRFVSMRPNQGSAFTPLATTTEEV